ncbi:CubicO group peptidase (beta-lactamase class C family) [Algoriphagus ratkowskyi]|uniref:Beta-lactamase family protein n=1 Tax=Algoriphagus ratkowskyi TaxID=57028 RepID=A0A2W7RKX3_9BACT|nr:serine hydrolase domain-containing protein [Algoriphagus ratkowskyi]PZX61034.1 CubicO group peptidase (beta-lactamase class C family) [Algoriphagus ratkowskyi]TXD79171.1 beta-lactamase family protein [Algoriphagus ratkowskyi]
MKVKAQKIRHVLVLLILWAIGFLAWEWWYSFPKVTLAKIAPEENLHGKIDSILYQAITDYRLPSLSLAVVLDGKVSYLNAIGYEDLQTKKLLTIDTPILVASVSKIFTALGVASVFQDKGITAQDYVRLLDSDARGDSTMLDSLTYHRLLTHQSGLRDKNFSEMIFSFSKSQSLQDWGADFLKNGNKFQTGSVTYSYADTNFDLLGYLLSRSENLPFDSIIQTSVLTPSGMVNSRFINSWPLEGNGLTGYQRTFLWKRLEPKRIRFRIFPSPSSGLLTTTKDMSLALIHLLRGEMGIYHKALDWLSAGETEAPLSFQKRQINGAEWIGHFGGQAGYSSLLFYSKEVEMGIFLFANVNDDENFRVEIANQVISAISQ